MDSQITIKINLETINQTAHISLYLQSVSWSQLYIFLEWYIQ